MNPFEQIQAGQLVNKIQSAVNLREFGNDPSTILNKSELELLEKAESNDIEKGEKANIGEVRDWGGKKYKKQPNGKWAEVSEYGMTKKDSEKELERIRFNDSKGHSSIKEQAGMGDLHSNIKNLSDKEHTDEEVGLGKKEEEMIGSGDYRTKKKNLPQKLSESKSVLTAKAWLENKYGENFKGSQLTEDELDTFQEIKRKEKEGFHNYK